MRTLVNEPAWVHYGQIYVRSGDDDPDFEESFTGQVNGLCGAAMPGHLFMITGLHTGHVGFTVEQTSYRVRYCATGMDEARELDTRVEEDEDPEADEDEDPAVDRYLLQFWPAPPEPDTVLRQTSEIAAYWHGSVRERA